MVGRLRHGLDDMLQHTNRLVTLSSRLVDGGLCVQELYNCQKKVPRVRNTAKSETLQSTLNIAKYIEV